MEEVLAQEGLGGRLHKRVWWAFYRNVIRGNTVLDVVLRCKEILRQLNRQGESRHAGYPRACVGFAQELSHTHEHTMPARETMNTRIFGDERLYLGLLFHWTWQTKRSSTGATNRQESRRSHDLPLRP